MLGGILGTDHVVQRVVERTKIRINLGHQVAGQEAQALTRFDRRTSEDDAVHRFGVQRLHGHSDGKPALARSGWSEGEGNHMLGDGVHIPALPRSLGPHRLGLTHTNDVGGQHAARTYVIAHHVDHTRQHHGIHVLTALQQLAQLFKQPSDRAAVWSTGADLVAAHRDGRLRKCPLNLAE